MLTCDILGLYGNPISGPGGPVGPAGPFDPGGVFNPLATPIGDPAGYQACMDDAQEALDLCRSMPVDAGKAALDAAHHALEAGFDALQAWQILTQAIFKGLLKISVPLAFAFLLYASHKKQQFLLGMWAGFKRKSGRFAARYALPLLAGWYAGCYLDYGVKVGSCREKYKSTCLNTPPLFPPSTSPLFPLVSK